MNYIIRFALLITVLVAICVFTGAQDKGSKGQKQPPKIKGTASNQKKTIRYRSTRLFNEFIALSQGSPEQKKVAHEAGKAYVIEFGNETQRTVKERVHTVNDWVAGYEAMLKARADLHQKFRINSTGNAEQQKVANSIGKEYVTTYSRDTDPENIQNVKSIQIWSADYERRVAYKNFIDNSKGNAEQRKVAHGLGTSYAKQYRTVDNADLQDVKRWVAAYDAAVKVRADLYQTWRASKDGGAQQEKVASKAGSDYLKEAAKEATRENAPTIQEVQQWVSSYEARMAKLALFQKFVANVDGTEQQKKLANETGIEYLSKYGKDTDDADDAKKILFIRQELTKYAKYINWKKFSDKSESSRASVRKEAYEAGKEYMRQYGTEAEPIDKERNKFFRDWSLEYESYTKFEDNSRGSSEQWKVAYQTAKEYVSNHGAVDNPRLKEVKDWIAKYDTRVALYKSFMDGGNTAEQRKVAYETGKSYVSQYGAVEHFELTVVKKWLSLYEAAKDLYEKFRNNYQGTPDQQKIAYKAGKEYVRTYDKNTDSETIQALKLIQDWLAKYEQPIPKPVSPGVALTMPEREPSPMPVMVS